MLHAGAALFLWQCLRSLNLRYAFLAALLFAIHPVQVESVAWVSERKNVLCGLFYFAACYAYLKHSGIGDAISNVSPVAPGGSPGLKSHSPRRWYLLALFLFFLALLSKTVACVLPAVMLVTIWYYRGKLTRRDLLRTVPFFILGLGLAVVTTLIEHGKVGTVGPDWDYSTYQRTIIAGRALWFYVGKLLYPYPLVSIYPRWWGMDPPAKLFIPFDNILYPLGVLAVVAVLWLLRRRLGRGPVAGVLCFIIMLAPALGFISFYTMLYTFVADHYQYLAAAAMLTLFTAAGAWLLGHVQTWLKTKGTRGQPSLVLTLAPQLLLAALIFSLSWQTFWQGRLYYRTLDLWKYNLDYNPDCFAVRNNYACNLFLTGQRAECIAQYKYVAEVLRPDDYRAYDNLCRIYRMSAQTQTQVIDQYLYALQIFFPDSYQAFAKTYSHYWQAPDEERAAYYYAQAELRKPVGLVDLQRRAAGVKERGPLPAAARDLLAQGDALLAKSEARPTGAAPRQDHAHRAEEYYRQATQLAPDWPEPWIRLSIALNRQGQETDGRKAFEKAVKLDPSGRDIILNMGLGQ